MLLDVGCCWVLDDVARKSLKCQTLLSKPHFCFNYCRWVGNQRNKIIEATQMGLISNKAACHMGVNIKAI